MGFTFIELLVVIAIIAILAALRLPALYRAKDCAKGNVRSPGPLSIWTRFRENPKRPEDDAG